MLKRGSLDKKGIIREMLESVWQLAYNINDNSPEPPHIKMAERERKRYGKIVDAYHAKRRKGVEKRKDKFRNEYYEVKSLFAFGKFDEAIKRLKVMQKKRY